MFLSPSSVDQSTQLNSITLIWINTEFARDDSVCRHRTVWREQPVSLAKAIEYHVEAFVEHSMSPGPSTLAALKISRRNLAEAAVKAIRR